MGEERNNIALTFNVNGEILPGIISYVIVDANPGQNRSCSKYYNKPELHSFLKVEQLIVSLSKHLIVDPNTQRINTAMPPNMCS